MRWLSTRVFRLIAVIVCVVVVWLFQPWSPYPPIGKLGVFLPQVQATALSDLDSVLPHRAIAATDDGEPFPRREAPLDVFYDWEGERRSSERFIQDAAVTGLFVLHDGAIAHERYRLEASAEDRRASFGLAEGVVALLVGAAVEEGRIASLSDRVDAYAPRYAASPIGSLSIAQILAAPDADARATGSGLARGYFEVFVLGRNPDGRLIAQVREALETRDGANPSGAETAEGADASPPPPPAEAVLSALDATVGGRSQVLAAVVRGAYGASLAEAAEAALWRPLDMADTASWSQHLDGPRGLAASACCLNATLRDYARLGALVNRDGVWQGERILPAGWAETVGLWAAPDGGGEVSFRGAYGQHLWIDARRDVVIVLAAADPDWREREAEAAAFLRAVAAAVVD